MASTNAGPTRRQNSACDQCRNRKVKCNMQPGDEKCAHCVNKGYQCTFVAQQETEKKRSVTGRRLVRNSPPSMPIKLPPGYHQYRPPPNDYSDGSNGAAQNAHYTEQPPQQMQTLYPTVLLDSSNPSGNGSLVRGASLGATGATSNGVAGPIPSAWPPARNSPAAILNDWTRGVPPPGAVPFSTSPYAAASPPSSTNGGAASSGTPYQYAYPGIPPPATAPLQDLLAYLFAPDPNSNPAADASLSAEYVQARKRLQEPEYRIEFATELIEVYFQVYHPRVPIVNPPRFRSQFREALRRPTNTNTSTSAGSVSASGGPGGSNMASTISSDGLPPPSKRARSSDDGNSSSSSSTTNANGNGSSSSSSSIKPLNRSLLACLLAWGSKFSDHSLLVMDRQQSQLQASSSTQPQALGTVSASSSFSSTLSTSTAATSVSGTSDMTSVGASPHPHSSTLLPDVPVDIPINGHDSKYAATGRGGSGNGSADARLRSNISRLLVDRAREIAEMDKVFRVAKPENVVVCLLTEPLQPLQSYPPTDPEGLKCLWLNAGIRHLMEMGVNRHPANPVPAGKHQGEPDDWGCMVFCWWIVCISDALCALYFKKKPALCQDDYDLREFRLITQRAESQPSMNIESDPTGSQEQAFMLWYSSAHDLAVCSRQLARTLCGPIAEKWGIPFDIIKDHHERLTNWRNDHLALVGANNDLQNIGDYVAAVTACTIDCSYHVMWIALSEAIGEYGIKEVNTAVEGKREATPMSPNALTIPSTSISKSESRLEECEGPITSSKNDTSVVTETNGESGKSSFDGIPAEVTHMVELERQIATEAFKSSTRIAGLAGVLTSNGYMRLDPNAMHWPIYAAGLLLARLGRQEVYNCIDGLNQNGYAYDEAWSHAKQLENTYSQYSAHGPLDETALIHNYGGRGMNGNSAVPPLSSSGRRPQTSLSPVVRSHHSTPARSRPSTAMS